MKIFAALVKWWTSVGFGALCLYAVARLFMLLQPNVALILTYIWYVAAVCFVAQLLHGTVAILTSGRKTWE